MADVPGWVQNRALSLAHGIPLAAPPPIPGLTRLEWDGAGIRFRILARPVIGRGGREVVPVTRVARQADGSGGKASCGSFVEAMVQTAPSVAGRIAEAVA